MKYLATDLIASVTVGGTDWETVALTTCRLVSVCHCAQGDHQCTAYPFDNGLGQFASTPLFVAVHLLRIKVLDEHGPQSDLLLLLFLCPCLAAHDAHLHVVIVIVFLSLIIAPGTADCRACFAPGNGRRGIALVRICCCCLVLRLPATLLLRWT